MAPHGSRPSLAVGLVLLVGLVVPVSAAAQSPLPTGRDTYRTLPEINAELRAIAEQHPDRVKLFTLSQRSLLGREIYGLEVSHDIDAPETDGKPGVMFTGIHHAREWPVAEFTMEFVWDLLLNDGTDPRITDLLERTKLYAIPVVNPDGYDVSRRIPSLQQKRKNCRFEFGVIPTQEQCDGAVNNGVDNNRNYGPFWGGPGSSASLTASNHRGSAPFSEPENQAMRDLQASNFIMVANNQHTPDERLLRVPTSSNEPHPTADEPLYDALTDRIAADNLPGWPSGPWTEVYYEASSTAEQQGYYTYGTFGYTTESTPRWSGNNRFHPPYQAVIDNYLGIGMYENQTQRGTLLDMMEAAADPALHSVLEGTAPPGAELALSKQFTMTTSDGTEFPVALRYTLTVPEEGRFTWHVNPSLRASQTASEHIQEAWTVECTSPEGTLLERNSVTLARGQRASMSLCTQGGVGGDVPATLGLTLGPHASFGTFQPGVAATYDATTTASVISTAADATLSVADPSAQATGHLVNGSYSLAEPVLIQANSPGATFGGPFSTIGGVDEPTELLEYTRPLSNDPVTLSFRQAIGANEGLRTGRYAKTLTFSLTTDSP